MWKDSEKEEEKVANMSQATSHFQLYLYIWTSSHLLQKPIRRSKNCSLSLSLSLPFQVVVDVVVVAVVVVNRVMD
jgi:hypothetical protein